MNSGTSAPRWQSWGGGGVLAAAVLQGTGLVGYYLTSVRAPALAVVIAGGFALLAATALLLATFPLALGTTRTNGIVGASQTGRIALIATGVFVLLARVTTLGFFMVGFPFAGGIAQTADALAILAVITGAVASVVIWRSGIATGAARWSLALAVVIATMAELASGYNGTLSWALAVASVASLGFAGLSYLRTQPSFSRGARGRVKNLAE